MIVTEIYKVFGCNDVGRPILYAEFSGLRLACQCAVAQYGKIHYNLPAVEKHTYYYDGATKEVTRKVEVIKPEQIYYMNQI